MASFDSEETNSTMAAFLFFFGRSSSSETRLVVHAGGNNSTFSALLWVSLCFFACLDTGKMVGPRLGNCSKSGVEPNQTQADKGSPHNGQKSSRDMCVLASISEPLLDQHNNSGLEGNTTGLEEKGNQHQKHDNVVNDIPAQAQEINDEGKAGESKGNKEESKTESGQVVVSISVANKLLRHTLSCGEVVDGGNGSSWGVCMLRKVPGVLDTPEGPSCGIPGTWDF